jgi:aspartyl-tRNA(Asn)/glutamyl-tRNA(Gln) amidotransferase subunit B
MTIETVIGLEIHVQLRTRSKMFCGDSTEFGAPPNTHVCPVCLGLPGALPVVNRRAVELGVRAALGLGCTVHDSSSFARKNYFYPDLPKGYQITQFDRPLATGGCIARPGAGRGDVGPTRIRLRRLHLEEDAGKSLHDRFAGRTAIDLNRAGVPLIEIVTEPDLRSPAQARAFLLQLKRSLEYLDVSDCDMEKGSLRVDANISIRPEGAAELGTKTEVKNMNSFANVERALAFEVERQTSLVSRGDVVVHETLLWDAVRGEARPMRSKEESHDYRYFPEPDLPPLLLDPAETERARASLPEMPATRRARFCSVYRLPDYDADLLTATRATADFFEAVVATGADPKAASNWVMTEVMAWANRAQRAPGELPCGAAGLAELIDLVQSGTVSNSMAKRIFASMVETGRSAREIVEAEGLVQVDDDSQIATWAREVVRDHPTEAERFRGGEERLFGFLMGQLMRRSAGRADPHKAAEALKRELG